MHMLKATHTVDGQTLNLELPTGRILKLGRVPQNDCAVVWDRTVSREHATLEAANGNVIVKCLPAATNPILFQGKPVREANVANGDWFQIGATRFDVTCPAPEDDFGNESEGMTDEGCEQYSYGTDDLKKVEFKDAGRQMEMLAGLPMLISESQTDVGLAETLAGLLLNAIPQATAVAAAYYNASAVRTLQEASGSEESRISILRLMKPDVMRVRTRDRFEGRFVPSRRLLAKSLVSGDCGMHIWTGGDQEGSGKFTISGDLDWAFCVPVPGANSQGWCLYVSGKGGEGGSILVTEDDLTGDLRFTQLVSQFLGSVRQVRQLKEQTTQLSSFFSPSVVANLTGGKDVLTPSEREITVLFCDVRGFSRKSEQSQGNLHHLLSCVKEALSAMTQGILQFDGAIADFQGDAALGFWGWPKELTDGAVPACLAAIAIQHEFEKGSQVGGLLEGFSVGVGIAHGRAIAGQIGTAQQAKIGVFGPVVNQGSRLEGMTRQFGVGVCMDEMSAEFARSKMPPGKARVRRLARVRPKGMDTPMTVSELIPVVDVMFAPTTDANALQPQSLDEMIANHESALDDIIAGRWGVALEKLETQPASGPKAFLLKQMAKTDNRPPENWDGAFSLTDK